ncbi:hypothetical protein LTR17_007175 [Elasticomyces elasticus]|nr:hypothetical protein LTR17_007175 [Elasticomyces elasticus]
MNGSCDVLFFRFNHAGDELLRSESGMLRTLLHRIFSRDTSLLARFVKGSQFAERCRTRGSPGSGWEWTVLELREAFGQVLACGTSRFRIFLDGLDEGSEDAAVNLVNMVHSASPTLTCAAELCFSSRPHTARSLAHHFRIDLEKENESDVGLYLDDRLSSFPHRTDLASVKKFLIKKTGSVFQWLVWIWPRVAELARTESASYIIGKIQGWPRALADVYAQQLQLIHLDDVPEALRIFEWVLLAKGVLSLDALRHAVCLEDGMSPESVIHLESSIHWSNDATSFAARSYKAGAIEGQNTEEEARSQRRSLACYKMRISTDLRFRSSLCT